MSRLLRALSAEGRADSSGHFTVDFQAAQEKLQQHQLADPRQFLLDMVQSAVALGAEAIDIETSGNRCTIIMKNVALPPEFLEHPTAFALLDGLRLDLDGYRELAVGLLALKALKPARVELASAASRVDLDGFTPRLKTRPHDPDTCVTITLSAHLQHLFSSPFEPMLQYVYTRAHYCPIPLRVNREKVHPAAVDQPLLDPSHHIDMWLGEQPGVVHFVKHGVEIATRTLTLLTPMVNATLYNDSLVKNLSHTDIVEEDSYYHNLAELDAACDRWLTQAMARYLEMCPRVQVRLRRQLLQNIASREADTLPALLQTLPLFETLTGGVQSLQDIRAHIAENQTVPCAVGDAHSGIPLLPGFKAYAIRCREPWSHLALQKVFGRAVVALDSRAVATVRNRQVHVATHVPDEDYLLVMPVEPGGELGLLRDTPPAHVVLDKTAASLGIPCCVASPLADVEGADLTRTVRTKVLEAYAWLAEYIVPPHPDVPDVQALFLRWMTPRSKDVYPDFFRDYPLFETLAGKTVSLRELEQDQPIHHAVGVPPQMGWEEAGLRHVVLGAEAVAFLKKRHRLTDDRRRLLESRKTRAAMARPTPELPSVAFETPRLRGRLALSVGAHSLVRFQCQQQLMRTETVLLDEASVEASVDCPEYLTGVTEAHQTEAVEALREALPLLVQHVVGILPRAVGPDKNRLRLFLIRYFSVQGSVPEAYLDVALFASLGKGAASVRELRQWATVRYVTNDVGALDVPQPVLVCDRDQAEEISRLVRRPLELWETGLIQCLTRHGFLLRPETPLTVSDSSIHIHSLENGCIGLLPMSDEWKEQSAVRLLWRHRLVETVWIPTPVPIDAVVNESTLSPLPTFDSVQRDDTYMAVLRSVTDALPDAMESLLTRATDPAVGETLLTWLSHRVKSAPSVLAARRESLVERIAGLPLLQDSVDDPVTVRDVATMVLRHGQCRFVPAGTKGRPSEEGQRLVQATVRVQECLRRLFDDVVDATPLLQKSQRPAAPPPPLGATPTAQLLHRVGECLSAWNERTLEVRCEDGEGIVTWDPATDTVTFNQKHPHVRRLLSDPHAQWRTLAVLASLALSRSSGGSAGRELELLAHATEWLLTQAGL